MFRLLLAPFSPEPGRQARSWSRPISSVHIAQASLRAPSKTEACEAAQQRLDRRTPRDPRSPACPFADSRPGRSADDPAAYAATRRHTPARRDAIVPAGRSGDIGSDTRRLGRVAPGGGRLHASSVSPSAAPLYCRGRPAPPIGMFPRRPFEIPDSRRDAGWSRFQCRKGCCSPYARFHAPGMQTTERSTTCSCRFVPVRA